MDQLICVLTTSLLPNTKACEAGNLSTDDDHDDDVWGELRNGDEDKLMMMNKMMMFGVSCVNNVWWEVEEGAPGNSNERLPQVQAQPHFSDTNPFSPTDVIFQDLQRSPCFFVSNAHHRLHGQVDNPM